MKIDVGPNTVSKLFSDDMVLTVPSFQRNYTWETSNTEQFLNDVFASAKSGESHFYGPSKGFTLEASVIRLRWLIHSRARKLSQS